MAQMMMPLILCCAVVSSSSFAMQFMGGGLGNLFDTSKLTGTMNNSAQGPNCNDYCRGCSETDFQELGEFKWVGSFENAKAMCTGNKSEFSGNNQSWNKYMEKIGTKCCS